MAFARLAGMQPQELQHRNSFFNALVKRCSPTILEVFHLDKLLFPRSVLVF